MIFKYDWRKDFLKMFNKDFPQKIWRSRRFLGFDLYFCCKLDLILMEPNFNAKYIHFRASHNCTQTLHIFLDNWPLSKFARHLPSLTYRQTESSNLKFDMIDFSCLYYRETLILEISSQELFSASIL